MFSGTLQCDKQGYSQSGCPCRSCPCQVPTTLQTHNLLSTSQPLDMEWSCLFHQASTSTTLVCWQVSAVSRIFPQHPLGRTGTPSSEGSASTKPLQLQASPIHPVAGIVSPLISKRAWPTFPCSFREPLSTRHTESVVCWVSKYHWICLLAF